MTWRRCSEEMPESHKDVLVWLADNWGATTPDEGTPHGNSDERTA